MKPRRKSNRLCQRSLPDKEASKPASQRCVFHTPKGPVGDRGKARSRPLHQIPEPTPRPHSSERNPGFNLFSENQILKTQPCLLRHPVKQPQRQAAKDLFFQGNLGRIALPHAQCPTLNQFLNCHPLELTTAGTAVGFNFPSVLLSPGPFRPAVEQHCCPSAAVPPAPKAGDASHRAGEVENGKATQKLMQKCILTSQPLQEAHGAAHKQVSSQTTGTYLITYSLLSNKTLF